MKAVLTYSLISAELKKGMYVLIDNKLGYVKSIDEKQLVINCYEEEDHKIKLKEVVYSNDTNGIVDVVIKLIAVVNNNPISINHSNYKKIFAAMLTYEKGNPVSYISRFIENKEWIKPINGNIRSIYSRLLPGDTAEIFKLEDIDKYELYDINNRICTILEYVGDNKYNVQFGNTDNTAIIERANLKKSENDTFKLFEVMGFDKLRELVNTNKVKTVEPKRKTPNTNTNAKPKHVNPFSKVLKSDWHATFAKLNEDDEKPIWLAVNEKSEQRYPISVPINYIPKHQFSGFDNNYWIPGTVKEIENPTADLVRFVPFREGLPIFGNVIENELSGKKFVHFVLDNIKQESINYYIYSNRDVTEERRSELTINKLYSL